MIIKLIKKNTGEEVIQELTEKYNSIEELEKEYRTTEDPLLYLDLEDWKYFKENPHETQSKAKTILPKEDIGLSELDLKNTIHTKTGRKHTKHIIQINWMKTLKK